MEWYSGSGDSTMRQNLSRVDFPLPGSPRTTLRLPFSSRSSGFRRAASSLTPSGSTSSGIYVLDRHSDCRLLLADRDAHELDFPVEFLKRGVVSRAQFLYGAP